MLLVDLKTGPESRADGLQLSALLHLWQNSKNRKVNRGFVFNPALHRYTLNGNILPNVTRVLKLISNYSYVPDSARDRGTYIHRCIEMYHNRTLNFSALKPEYQGIVLKWREMLISLGLQDVNPLCEHRMYHKDCIYAGTADLIFPLWPEISMWNAYLKTNPVRWKFIHRENQHAENLGKFLALLSAYNQIMKAGDPHGIYKGE